MLADAGPASELRRIPIPETGRDTSDAGRGSPARHHCLQRALDRRVRGRQHRAEAITPELLDRLLAPLINSAPAPAGRQQAERIYRTQMIYPDSTAHFSRVQVSRDGALWVQAFRGPTTDEVDHWTVVDLHAFRTWRLELPAGSRVLGVDSARVLVGTKDEDDVETQAWWSLPELAGIRPPAACSSR